MFRVFVEKMTFLFLETRNSFWSIYFYMYLLFFSHRFPVNSGGHWQNPPFCLLRHVPPFLQVIWSQAKMFEIIFGHVNYIFSTFLYQNIEWILFFLDILCRSPFNDANTKVIFQTLYLRADLFWLYDTIQLWIKFYCIKFSPHLPGKYLISSKAMSPVNDVPIVTSKTICNINNTHFSNPLFSKYSLK